MKHITQFLWILLFSFLGQLLHSMLPLPIPASVYGLVLLFLALLLKLVRLEWIRETGRFLVNIMAVMFVCPAVGLLGCWDVVKENLAAVCSIIAVSLVLTFWVSGTVTEKLLKKEAQDD